MLEMYWSVDVSTAVVCVLPCSVFSSGIIQSPVRVHLCPQMIDFPLYFMLHPILLNVISHPALHSVTTETREWEDRFGSMCASLARSGRVWSLSRQVCVEQTMSPFGSLARMGAFVGVISVAGAAVVRKWLLAPESRMAHSCMFSAVSVIVCSSEGVGVEQVVVVV